MNDEINEIIEYLKDEHIYVEDFGYSYKRLSLDENKALLNYITNLQEENERFRTIKWQIKNLKQEWLDIVENETLVFDNDNLLNFMNKLERILRGEE